jgi:pilus assembly protein Flp/PilA
MLSRHAGEISLKVGLNSRRIRLMIEDCRGVTAIEYALIAALIAIAAIGAFTAVGTDLSNTFSSIASQL